MYRIGPNNHSGSDDGRERAHARDDRRAVLAVAATLVLQTAAVLVWVGSAGERLKQIETRVGGQPDLVERTAGLETEMVYIRRSLDRIERKLDAMTERAAGE